MTHTQVGWRAFQGTPVQAGARSHQRYSVRSLARYPSAHSQAVSTSVSALAAEGAQIPCSDPQTPN